MVVLLGGHRALLQRRQRRAPPAGGGVEVERVEAAGGPAVGNGDDQRAVRAQHAMRLLQDPARVGDVLDHLEQHDRVHAASPPAAAASRPRRSRSAIRGARGPARAARGPAPRRPPPARTGRVRRSRPTRSPTRSRRRARAARRPAASAGRDPNGPRRRAAAAWPAGWRRSRPRTGRPECARGRRHVHAHRRPPADSAGVASLALARVALQQLRRAGRPGSGRELRRQAPGGLAVGGVGEQLVHRRAQPRRGRPCGARAAARRRHRRPGGRCRACPRRSARPPSARRLRRPRGSSLCRRS